MCSPGRTQLCQGSQQFIKLSFWVRNWGDVGRLLEHPIHPPSTSRLDCANTDYIITPGAPPPPLVCLSRYKHSIIYPDLANTPFILHISYLSFSQSNFLWPPLSCFCLLQADAFAKPKKEGLKICGSEGSRSGGEMDRVAGAELHRQSEDY